MDPFSVMKAERAAWHELCVLCRFGVKLIRIYSFEQGEYTACSENSTWYHGNVSIISCLLFLDLMWFCFLQVSVRMCCSCVFVADTFAVHCYVSLITDRIP